MNKFISKNLVLEGMRQLRVVGFIALVLAMLTSFLTIYGYNISAKNYYEYNSMHNKGFTQMSDYVQHVAPSAACVPIPVVGFFLAPLMVLIIFSFLNKRNSSDFYHGIVERRECLCNSFSLSVLLWCIIIMLSSLATSVLASGVMSFVALDPGFFSDAAFWLVEYIIICFYWIAVLLLSMSLSGTIITNLAVTAMLLFLPKIIYLSIMGIVVEEIDIYPFAYDDSIFSGKYNLVTGRVMALFDMDFLDESNWQLYGCIYTVILAALLYVAGCVAFKLRKSETATQAAVSPRLQMVFRLVPAFVVTLVPCALLYEQICSGWKDTTEMFWFGIVVMYVIAAVVYFLYEIITTRRWRNITKAFPGLLILLLLDAIYVGVMFGERAMILNNVPKTENVTSVCILGTRMSDMETDDYFYIRRRELEITDSRTIRLLSDGLASNVEMIKNNVRSYTSGRRVLVQFNEGNKKTYRLVFLSDSAAEYVLASGELSDYKVIIQDLANLPCLNVYSYNSLPEMSEEMEKLFYNKFIQNVSLLNEEQIYKLLNKQNNSEFCLTRLGGNVKYKGKSYYINIPIFYSLDNIAEYVELYNAPAAGQHPLDLGIEKYNQGKEGVFKVSVYNYSGINSYTQSYNKSFRTDSIEYEAYDYDQTQGTFANNSDLLNRLERLLEQNADQKFECGRDYVIVSYYDYDSEITCSRIYTMRPGYQADILEEFKANYND